MEWSLLFARYKTMAVVGTLVIIVQETSEEYVHIDLSFIMSAFMPCRYFLKYYTKYKTPSNIKSLYLAHLSTITACFLIELTDRLTCKAKCMSVDCKKTTEKQLNVLKF